MRNRARSSKGGVTTAESGGNKYANCWHGKEKQVHQVQSGAATVRSSNSQASVSTNNIGAKEIGLIESVQEDSEMGWLFMIADSMTIEQLSMDGAHNLVRGS